MCKEILNFTASCVPPKTTAQQKGVFILHGKPIYYKKASVRDAENTFWEILKPARTLLGKTLDTPICVNIELVYPHTKSTPKKYLESKLPMTTKPDVDNVVKSLLDVMTKMTFWRDDSLIYKLSISKYRAKDPSLSIQIFSHC